MEHKPKLLKNICLIITSIWLLTVSICLILFWPILVEFLTNLALTFSHNSKAFNIWKKTPIPLTLDFYFFNWTNPEEVYDSNATIKFEQLGPYRFSETKEKINVTWNPNNTVTYRLFRNWYHDEEASNGSLLDELISVNPISLTAAYRAKDWNLLVKKGLSMTLRTMAPTVHIKKTIKELLFDGYDDPFINMARAMPFLTEIPPWDKFGWFYQRNGSSTFDGVFNMGTGIHSEYGRLYNWNYRNHTPFFDDHCGNVHGSAGELYTRPLHKTNIGFFSPDLCRHVMLDYVENAFVHGVSGYKYTVGESFLDNGTKISENWCYCSGECQPSGVVNVSTCRYGSPAFASLPHFYSADPVYLNLLEGLEPKQEKHEFYMIMEPNTGLPLELAVRLQLNLLMQPVDYISVYEGVPKIYFPVLWFEQKIRVPKYMATQLKMLLKLPLIIVVFASIMGCSGIILLAYVTYKLFFGSEDEKVTFTCMEEVPLKSEKRVKSI